MNLRHVTLHQLRIFGAVAQHGSFARAAEALHLSPPTLSLQVKQLADTVGQPLFDQKIQRAVNRQRGDFLGRFFFQSFQQGVSAVRLVVGPHQFQHPTAQRRQLGPVAGADFLRPVEGAVDASAVIVMMRIVRHSRRIQRGAHCRASPNVAYLLYYNIKRRD